MLLSTTRKAAALSPPLPMLNEILARAGVYFRRGQFSMIASAPSVGKSVVATNLAVFTKVPTLFFSADSDEWTVRQRAISILTATPLDEVEKNLANSDAWEAHYAKLLRGADHVDWSFNTDINTEFICNRIEAYAEVRGLYPEFVIVDNLANTVVDQENEYPELRGTCRELQEVARMTKAHVMALHHVGGDKESGEKLIGMGDVLGKLAKFPEQVFGLNFGYNRETVVFNIAKYRGGKPGTLELPIDYSRALLGGFKYDRS